MRKRASSHTAGLSSCGMREQRKKCKTDQHLWTVRRGQPAPQIPPHPHAPKHTPPTSPVTTSPIRLSTRFSSSTFQRNWSFSHLVCAAVATSFMCFFKVEFTLSPCARVHAWLPVCTHARVCVFVFMEIHGCVSSEVREGPWEILHWGSAVTWLVRPRLVSFGSRGWMGCLHASRLYLNFLNEKSVFVLYQSIQSWLGKIGYCRPLDIIIGNKIHFSIIEISF